MDAVDVDAGRAVKGGHLGAVDHDVGVGDAEAVKGGHQVLDGLDLGVADAQGGREGGFDHEFGKRGNLGLAGKVGADEADAGVLGGRVKGEVDGFTGVEADAFELEGAGKRPLGGGVQAHAFLCTG